MYEAVHAHPDGDATAARHALAAAEHGYDGVVVRNHGDRQAEYDAAAVAAAFGVDVVEGIELRTDDHGQLSGLIDRYRDERTVIAVHGGDVATNRFACERARVDVLAHPMRGEGDVNHVVVKVAKRNGVRLEFNLAEVLRADGGPRVKAIRGLRRLRELVEHYDAPFVVSGDPHSHLELRAPREVVAVAERVGFSAEQVREGYREWGRLAERNRERTSESFIEPGVRGGRYEADDR